MWVVECPANSAGPFPSQAAAQSFADHVTALGACMWDHDPKEVA